MLKGKKKKLYDFITTRMKATQSEKRVIMKFLENVDEDELKGRKPLAKISFRATWRLYKLIELAPNEAERLLSEVKDKRWFQREVVRSLRGKVLGLNEETEEEKKKKKNKKNRYDMFPRTIPSKGAGIITPFPTTVSTGKTPSLGPVNVLGEQDDEIQEMSVYEALKFSQTI